MRQNKVIYDTVINFCQICCIDRSRGRDRRLWHLRVCVHPWENGISSGKEHTPGGFLASSWRSWVLRSSFPYATVPQASCRSLARLESAQDAHTTIYDVIQHVPEMPCHSWMQSWGAAWAPLTWRLSCSFLSRHPATSRWLWWPNVFLHKRVERILREYRTTSCTVFVQTLGQMLKSLLLKMLWDKFVWPHFSLWCENIRCKLFLHSKMIIKRIMDYFKDFIGYPKPHILTTIY